MSFLKKINILFLIFLLSSCISTTVYYKIFRDGKVKVTITFMSEYEAMIGLMLENIKDSEDFKIIDSGYNGDKYYIKAERLENINSDTFSFLKLNEKTDKLVTTNSSRISFGLLKKRYIINTTIGSKRDSTYYDEYDYLRKMMPVKLIFEMPGNITKTTGVKITNNKVSYSFTFYDLQNEEKKIYIEAEESELDKLISAQKRLSIKLEENLKKIDELNSAIEALQEEIKNHKKLNTNLEKYRKESENLKIKAINEIIDYYYLYYKEYPKDVESLKSFSSQIVKGYPIFEESYYYDPDRHKVFVKEE